MIVGVDHVQITVPAADVEAARAFYCGLLGLREIDSNFVIRSVIDWN
jgi:catechol 2,3-dioxygenase-like lactoylglutathione lyase family enzyme